MKVTLIFKSKNDGRDYFIEFESIEEYLKHSKTFENVAAYVTLTDDYIQIRLTESIYHTGEYTNIPSKLTSFLKPIRRKKEAKC